MNSLTKQGSLQELTSRKGGILLFHYDGGTEAIVADWQECPAGCLPMVFLGRSLVHFPCNWECVGKRSVSSVWDTVPENTNIVFDDGTLWTELDPEGVVYELKTSDNRRISVICSEEF